MIYCLFVSAVVFGTHECLYVCLDVFTFFTLIHFLSSAFLPRLNRSRLHSCSGSSVLPRDQEVQGVEEEERWTDGPRCCCCCCCYSSSLIFDPWTCMNGYRHGNTDTWPALCPQWRGPLSLCCSENDSNAWQKTKAGPHICLCVTPHSHPSRVTQFFFFFFLFMLHWFFVQVLWMLRGQCSPHAKTCESNLECNICTFSHKCTHVRTHTDTCITTRCTWHVFIFYLYVCIKRCFGCMYSVCVCACTRAYADGCSTAPRWHFITIFTN